MLLIYARTQVSQIYSANMFENHHVPGHRELSYGGTQETQWVGAKPLGAQEQLQGQPLATESGRSSGGGGVQGEGQMNQVLR